MNLIYENSFFLNFTLILLTLFSFNFSDVYYIISQLLCLGQLGAIIAFHFFMAKFLWKLMDRTKEPVLYFKFFFYDMKLDLDNINKNRLYVSYHSFNFIKKIATAIIILAVMDYPVL